MVAPAMLLPDLEPVVTLRLPAAVVPLQLPEFPHRHPPVHLYLRVPAAAEFDVRNLDE